MKVEIRTTDTAWASRRATPGRDGRVVVAVEHAEHVTFAGKPMVSFDLGADLPKDWANRWGMAPVEWIV